MEKTALINNIVQNNYSFYSYSKELFSSEFLKLFIIVLLLWILNCFLFFMNAYGLPLILKSLITEANKIKEEHINVLKILFSTIIPIPGEILAGYLTSTSYLFWKKEYYCTWFSFSDDFITSYDN